MVKINARDGIKITPSTAVPTAAKGALYFNDTDSKFKICEDGSLFKNLLSGTDNLLTYYQSCSSSESVSYASGGTTVVTISSVPAGTYLSFANLTHSQNGASRQILTTSASVGSVTGGNAQMYQDSEGVGGQMSISANGIIVLPSTGNVTLVMSGTSSVGGTVYSHSLILIKVA